MKSLYARFLLWLIRPALTLNAERALVSVEHRVVPTNVGDWSNRAQEELAAVFSGTVSESHPGRLP